MGVGGKEEGPRVLHKGERKHFWSRGWGGLEEPQVSFAVRVSLSELTVFPPPHCPSLLRLGGTAGRHLRKWLTCRFHQDLFFFFKQQLEPQLFCLVPSCLHTEAFKCSLRECSSWEEVLTLTYLVPPLTPTGGWF